MSQVKLILSEAVSSLGEAGDVVSVKPGFARNFLIPQGKAAMATAAGIKEVEHKKRVIAEKAAKMHKDLESLRDRLQSLSLEVSVKVGEEGKLFGSITTAQIATLLGEKGFEIDRRKITLDEPIKQAGDHIVPIRLAADLIAQVPLKISPEE